MLTLGVVAALAVPNRVGAEGPAAGTDDGFGLAIHATGDFVGSFEPCGCKVPIGGYPRRAGYADMVAALTGGEATVVQVDAGRMLAPEQGLGYVSVDDTKLKNEWVLRAAAAIDMAAANVAIYDLPFLATLMHERDFANAKTFPILERYVSANIVPADATMHAFKPFVVEEVRAPRFGDKPLRVGIIGVTEVPRGSQTLNGYKILDPFEALGKHGVELRKQCDVMVVLAYMDRNAVRKVEPALPGVDVVVVAHQFPLFKFSGPADTPVYLFADTLAKAVAEVRLYPADAGGSRRFGKASVRNTELTGDVESNSAASELIKTAIKQFRKME